VRLWQPVCEDGGAARCWLTAAAGIAGCEAGQSAHCPCPHTPALLLAAPRAWVLLSVAPGCKSKVTALKPKFLAGCCDGAELDLHTRDSTANCPVPTGENQGGFTAGSTGLHPPGCTGKMNVKIRLALFDLLNTNNFNPPVSKKQSFS